METSVIELIGYVASALIVLSLMMQSLLRLRVINLVGAFVFTVYGVLIDAPPVWLVNGAIVFIDLWYLRQMLAADPPELEALEVSHDSAYLAAFIAGEAEGIVRFQPEFDGIRDDHRAFLVLRDLVPAALVLVRPTGDAEWTVDLDYARPAYRDFTQGGYVYGQSGLWRELGAARIVAPTPSGEVHAKYLRKMGFVEDGDRMVRAL